MKQSDVPYDFEVGVYRPPSEGGSDSLLLRITRNCPWNRCTFCSMYKTETFELRTPEAIKGDIDAIAHISGRIRELSLAAGTGGRPTRQAARDLLRENPSLGDRHGFFMVFNWMVSGGKTVFLQDANSLIMKTAQLVEVLQYLRKTFPTINRVTSYARSRTLAQKPLEELKAIRKAGLDRLHVGLETGDDLLLEKIKKGVTAQGHIDGGRKAMEAGFQLSEYWMPGLGGKTMWENHALNTARVLNAINPHYIRSRPFFPAPGTPLYAACRSGEFERLSPREGLLELKRMIENLTVDARLCFDHAGNYWRDGNGRLLFSQSYEGYALPGQKSEVLKRIESGMKVGNRHEIPV